MIIQPRNPSSQSGIVMVLMTIGMVVLLGMAGLSLDMGHSYLMKTRLQNALDAAALSGAKTLNSTGGSVVQAEADARNTFSVNAGDDINDTGLTPVVEFSDILFNPGQALDPQYIRVSLRGYQQPMWFAQVLPGVGDNKLVGASAVAGPSPVLAELCDIMPMMICGDPLSTDEDCSDGACWGFDPPPGEEIALKIGSDVPSPIGPGNFQLIQIEGDKGSKGGAAIRENLAGSYKKCLSTDSGDNVETEPGNKVGPVFQGINTRFGESGLDPDTYPPDLVSDAHSPDYFYADYAGFYASAAWDHPPPVGAHFRRIVTVPIGDCEGKNNGRDDLPLLGIACFFLTRPANHNGSQEVRGEMIPGCEAHGTAGNDPGTGTGPRIIQLYKDPDSGDA